MQRQLTCAPFMLSLLVPALGPTHFTVPPSSKSPWKRGAQSLRASWHELAHMVERHFLVSLSAIKADHRDASCCFPPDQSGHSASAFPTNNADFMAIAANTCLKVLLANALEDAAH